MNKVWYITDGEQTRYYENFKIARRVYFDLTGIWMDKPYDFTIYAIPKDVK